MMALLGFFAISKNVFPIGFVPGKSVGDLNTIIPQLFHQLFPAWSAGIAYATLAVAALIPAAIMSISAANVFTRAIYMDFIRPRASARGGAPGQPVGVAVHEVRRRRRSC